LKFIQACRCAAIPFVLSLACVSALAQDTTANREVAADRYLKVVPMAKMLDDTITELGKQVPAERRDQFIADMKKVVRADYLESMSRASMIKTFTTDELNALADFYGSKEGSSAMQKFGAYMGDVMPAILAEVQRGVHELQKSQPQK
jgi:uncharacterized protein